MITQKEKQAFEETGFHIIRNALTMSEVENYRDAMRQLFQTPETHPYANRLRMRDVPPEDRPADNPRAIWNGFDLPLFDDRFYDLIFHPVLALTLDGLIGPDINFYETCFVSKLPRFPGTFRDWHQDSAYFDPQTNDRNAAVAVYLDEMDEHSGATGVIPGSHKQGPLPHVLPSESHSSSDLEVIHKRDYDARAFFPHFYPGDALIFLARCVHKSGANESETSRTSLIYNYTRRDTLDLGEKNRSIGNGIPVTRNGKLYVPGH